MIVVLIGPGGVGKGTVARRLVERDARLFLSRSWTTRPVRPSERGDEYVFVDRERFAQAIAADEFLEWAQFHGNLYGTPVPPALSGRDLLLEIDVQGAIQVRRHDPQAVVILVEAPSTSELENRLRRRGDDDEHVASRLASTPGELAAGRALADAVVVNDDVERVAGEIISILDGIRREPRPPAAQRT